jgi:hypothetical protein
LSGLAIATAFAPLSFVAEFETNLERRRQAAGSLVGIVGHWSVGEDRSALKADGSKWSGTTSTLEVQTAARPLFGELTDGFVANATAPGAFPLAVWSPVREFTEGTIRVQFNMVGGPSDQNAGIVIGLQPNGDYLFVRYNTKDGDVAIWQYSGGERRVISHGKEHVQLPLQTWHELAVTVAGTKVIGSVNNGAATLEHTLDKPLSGRVGVWTKRDAITVFKNYRISR